MSDQKDIQFEQATVILTEAVNFLAQKHGVTTADIWAGVIGKHERICTQLAEVLTWGIEVVQNNKG